MDASVFEKAPPYNLEAEQAVLGAISLDREIIFSVLEVIKADDFYKMSHRVIFNAFISLYDQGEPIDIVTLSNFLQKENLLDQAGGVVYLMELADKVPTTANAVYYAKIVAEKAILRSLINAAQEILAKSYQEEQQVEDLIDEAEKLVFSVAERKAREGFATIRDVALKTFEEINQIQANDGVTGIPTFQDLDHYLSGLQKSDMIIVAARPGMGKTSFCLNIAQNAAKKHRKKIALFSLEMGNEQLAQRMLCAEARVDQTKVRSGRVSEEEWRRLSAALGILAEGEIYLDDTPGITILEMRAKTRKLKAEKGLDLVIVDYLQLMQGNSRLDNRQQEISEISRGIKSLARELDVPVMALSQLSRAVEQSADKKPSLSHLRESGALEQDADVVMFIHRPEVYDEETDKRGIAEISIAKHRNGPTGTVELAFINECTKFLDLARRE